MALHEIDGNVLYADSSDDLPDEIQSYSLSNGYQATQFKRAVCKCGGDTFRLLVDELQGAAVRACHRCGSEHPIGDSTRYLSEANLEECECPCGNRALQVTAGVALYADSEDVRWLYLGCRCLSCGLAGVYADWKNEYPDYQDLFARI